MSPAIDPTIVFLGQDNSVLPSDMLSDAAWVQRVIDLFDLGKFNITTEVSQQQKDQADLLVKIERERFREHLSRRLPSCVREGPV